MLWQTTPSVLDELGLRGDLDRYTGGVRILAKGIGPFDYNSAVVRQWGSVGAASISAWGSYAELGYTLRMPWTPRVYAEYTFGSGDADSTDGVAGGFADLFPTAHLWYRYNDMVGWRNLKNVRVGSQLKPIRELSVRLDYHSFWLADKADGLYNVAGRRTVTAPAAGATDAKIGDEVDATLTVPLTPTITVGGGLGYMFPGPFLEAHSPGSGNTFTFLFGRLQVLNAVRPRWLAIRQRPFASASGRGPDAGDTRRPVAPRTAAGRLNRLERPTDPGPGHTRPSAKLRCGNWPEGSGVPEPAPQAAEAAGDHGGSSIARQARRQRGRNSARMNLSQRSLPSWLSM